MAESNGNAVTEPKEDIKEITEVDAAVAKSDSDITSLSNLDKQIIRQIEYYFGDVNLVRDKFLQEQVKLDDGWVPLEIMIKFKRLAVLSTDAQVILASLEKSPQKLMEISEDRLKIRRSPSKPLPIFNEQRRKELMSRTAYAKGFPATGVTLDDLLEFFNPFGPIENLQMRTLRDKVSNEVIFKGSVYVLFHTVERAKEFLDLETVKYKETELIRKWQADHIEGKKKERDDRRGKGKAEGAQGGDKKAKDEVKKTTGITSQEFTKGCLLHVTGFSGEITREDIKGEFAANGAEVAYVHFSKGDTEGWVRLGKENAAKELLEKLEDGKMEVCGSELELRLMEGEEEDTFLTKSMDDLKQRRSKNSRGGGRGRGGRGNRGNRGGRGFAHKRRGSPTRGNANDAKKQAT